MQEEPERRDFRSFADLSWFREPNNSSIRIRFYRITAVPHAFLARLLRGISREIALEVPVKIHFAIAEDFKFDEAKVECVPDSVGMPNIQISKEERNIPGGAMVIFASPEVVDGRDLGEATVGNCMDSVQAILALQIGSCFFSEQILETKVNVGTGAYSLTSRTVRVGFTGPSISADRWSSFNGLLKKLEVGLLQPNRMRIRLAIERLAIAYRSEAQFIEYWIALEVLCGGGAPKMRAKLAEAYGLKRVHDVDQKFGFSHVSRARHDLMHKGKRIGLSLSFEAYLCAMFLDILSYEFGVPQPGNLSRLVNDRTQDLSFIGIEPLAVAEVSAPENRDIEKDARVTILDKWEALFQRIGI